MSQEKDNALEFIGGVAVIVIITEVLFYLGFSAGSYHEEYQVTVAHCEGYCAREEREGRWDGKACTCVLPGSDAVWKPKP